MPHTTQKMLSQEDKIKLELVKKIIIEKKIFEEPRL